MTIGQLSFYYAVTLVFGQIFPFNIKIYKFIFFIHLSKLILRSINIIYSNLKVFLFQNIIFLLNGWLTIIKAFILSDSDSVI